jgi:hemoglobin
MSETLPCALDEAGIARQVHEFYARVRSDTLLGPVFEAAIAPADWPEHLRTMCRFWSSVMLCSGSYSGNPVAVHRSVAGIAPELFPRWLGLFSATASDLFAPDIAAAFTDKATRIAGSLRMAVFFRPGQRPEIA